MVLRKSLLAGAVAASLLVGPQAAAQQRVFDVPAQPAVDAIPELARQGGVQILAPANGLKDVRTTAIAGEMDVRVALDRLLDGTPLAVASDDGQVITLRTAAASAASTTAESRRETGTISGRILDPATGEYLRSAIIRVTSSDGRQTITSGDRGEYRVTGVQAGRVEMVVSFTNYVDRRVSVEMMPGQSLRQDFDLVRLESERDAGAMLDQVVVVGSRDGDARAIMSQRDSLDIMNSLSSESFGEVSEGNVGEFVKFMPGVDADMLDGTARYVNLRGLPSEYTAVTVDGASLASVDANTGAGSSRSFSFEQVSLSNIESIEIFKTTSADMEANAPAGTINLRTKRAFDRQGRRLFTEVSGTTQSDLWGGSRTYGDPGDGRQDRIMPSGRFEYSDVFLDRRLGVMLSLSEYNTYIQRDRMTAPWNYVPTAASPDAVVLGSFQAQQIKQQQERIAGGLTLDFRATDNLILSLSTMYNESDTWSGQRSWIFTTDARQAGIGTAGDPMLDFATQSAQARVQPQALSISKRGEGLTVIPSFEYQNERMRIDGRIAYSESESRYDPLGWRGSIFGAVNQARLDANFHAERSGLDEFDWTFTQIDGADWSDPSNWGDQPGALTFNTQDGRWAKSRLPSADLNVTFYGDVGRVPVTFKTGVKARRDVYDFANEREAHRYTYAGPLSIAEFWAQHETPAEFDFGDDGLHFVSRSGNPAMYMPSNYSIGQLFLTHPEQFEHSMTAANYYNAFIANRRHFEEDMNAAYAMATAEFTERLTARVGLRWEETTTRAREYDPLSYAEVVAAGHAASTATGRATTVEGIRYQYQTRPRIERGGRYDRFFPSASFRYAFDDDTELQFGYSRTIRRPEISQLAGVQTVNEDEMLVTVPNPGLEPEISDNLSLRLARYFEPVGMIGLNLYQNRIRGMFESVDMTAAEYGYVGDEYANYMFRSTTNVGGTAIEVRGVELEYAHSLDFLPDPFKGFSVRGSYSYNDAEADIVGMAPHMAVLVLGYRRGGLGLSLNTKWVDDKLFRASDGVYIEERVEMNLSGTYQLRRGWQAFFSVRNLLDEPYTRVRPAGGDASGAWPEHANYYQRFGLAGTLGLRATF